MTTKSLAVAFAALTVLSGVVAGVAVTGTAAAAPSDVSSCTVIDEPGEYRLTTDITNESTSSCIEIEAENVTFDGDGHTIDGVDGDGSGILSGYGEDVVKNVVVRNFESGLVVNTNNVDVQDSVFADNTVGVQAIMGGGVFENVTVTRNVNGVESTGALTYRASSIVDNEENGIEGGTYADPTLEGSLVADNGESGISVTDGTITSENTTYRNNGGYGFTIALGTVDSTDDTIVDNAAGGVHSSGETSLDGTTVEDNGGNGIDSTQTDLGYTGLDVTDSVIRGNDGDGVLVGLPYGSAEIHGSVIADNADLGVNNTGSEVANATGSFWGASDGPSSADDEDAPFADPETGALANGSGDGVSENASQSGVSNVHFDSYLTENPFADDGDDGTDDGDDGTDDGADDGQDDSDDESNESDDGTSGDDGASDGDDSENDSDDSDDDADDGQNGDDGQSGQDSPAYQIDVATGDVIEQLGVDGDDADDAPDFYGEQGRLLQATTMTADGAVTGAYAVPDGEVTKSLNGCAVSYEAVSYDASSGEVTLDVSVSDDANCEDVTLTLAGYELPGDDTTFVREHADGQELVDHRTVTLASGDDTTVTIDLDG
ncbi:right-handed parallel beta-helix repeat-containing protein [Halomarina salina]|uniref:Right-handed parallel beta-helix repeat-containing protein n=1 Tax=Halomarina salina TaxID=1872699 RepID=A0ABD5RUQ9_9EURY|nr:right-handed parallel beta-helix repeat-containing protein [Halomarina salina]